MPNLAYPIRRRPAHHAGFSLVELMLTLVILSILGSLALPAMQALMARDRAVTTANSLLGLLTLARGAAIAKGVRVTICRIDDVSVAVPSCLPASSDWNGPVMAYINPGKNGQTRPDDAAGVIGITQLSTKYLSVTRQCNDISWVTFGAHGQLVGNVRQTNLSFAIVAKAGARGTPTSRYVCLIRTGRARVVDENCSECEPDST